MTLLKKKPDAHKLCWKHASQAMWVGAGSLIDLDGRPTLDAMRRVMASSRACHRCARKQSAQSVVDIIAETIGTGTRWFGYELSRETHIGPRHMYPALTVLMAEGRITDGWDNSFVPPRRYYVGVPVSA